MTFIPPFQTSQKERHRPRSLSGFSSARMSRATELVNPPRHFGKVYADRLLPLAPSIG
jgi:hypothetical protein